MQANFSELKEWKNLKSFGKCNSHVIYKGKGVWGIFHLYHDNGVINFSEAVGNHRVFENHPHRCLDVYCKRRWILNVRQNTAANRAMIHRSIYNRIKIRLKSKEQLCLGKLSCMYNDDYRVRIIFSHI